MIDEQGGSLRLTSEEIGGLLGLGEARVLRLFSREVGKTLRQHSLDVRMARAAQLLKNVAPPIKTVASDCGYSLLSNFYRDFKRVHGISPLQMRLRHMNLELHTKESELSKRFPAGSSAA
jgi:AraC-like DNA-binding protein